MERKLTYVAEKNNQQCLTERDEVSIFNYEHLHFLVKRTTVSLSPRETRRHRSSHRCSTN